MVVEVVYVWAGAPTNTRLTQTQGKVRSHRPIDTRTKGLGLVLADGVRQDERSSQESLCHVKSI